MPNNPPLIIAGMHRSGTSLAASLVAASGVRLGGRLLPPDAGNPAGYFEDVDLVALQGRILTACTPAGDGGHRDWGWTESEQLDRGRLADFRGEARAIVAARDARPGLWGWKDPRTTLLLDFWDELLPGARYLLLYRFPWDVADSMQRLGADVFLDHPEYGYRIWSFYNRHLLGFHRRHRDRSVLVSADAVVQRPERLAAPLRERLGVALDGAAPERLIDRAAYVSRGGSDPLIALAAAASPEAVELLAALDRAAEVPATGLWSADRRSLRLAPAPEDGPVDLSIVVPCFDHGEFLLEAVASAERAAPAACELIVVDDGSRQPRTREVLAALGELGYRALAQPNAGLAVARNNGIAASRGRYLLPLDADNRLRPGYAAAAVRLLDQAPAIGVVYGDRHEFGQRSRTVNVPEFDLDRLLAANYIDACAVFRREVWSDCGGFDGAMPAWEDWEFWISAAERGWGFHHVPGVGFDYRVRPHSLVTQCARAEVGEPLRHYMIDKHRELYLGRLPSLLTWAHEGAARAADLAAAAASLRRQVEELREQATRAAAAAEHERRERDRLAARAAALVGEREGLAAREAALAGERDRLYLELDSWRRRVTFMEGTWAWKLRRLVVEWRRRLGTR